MKKARESSTGHRKEVIQLEIVAQVAQAMTHRKIVAIVRRIMKKNHLVKKNHLMKKNLTSNTAFFMKMC